ncbi:MAG: SRPBCC domain-containing protein [Pseudonocardia sp.]|nr:SRPBCC domain-containing protein [Pseudonocardia sp.]
MAREFEIRKEIEINADPERIWEAIATGPGITSWFMPHEVEPGEGGTVRLTVPGFEADSTITTWEPGKRLAYRGPTGDDGTVHAMEFLIEARDGGSTVLRLVHSGMLGDNWDDDFQDSTAHGWDMYLHTLAEYVTHFFGRPVVYINADGPAASAAEDGWSVLRAGLGLDGPVELGDEVRLTPDGLEPIEGVADYVGPEFLGVRTADAMYRFHGLGRLGIPVAVGHHIFRDDVDRARLDRDWASWTERLYAS